MTEIINSNICYPKTNLTEQEKLIRAWKRDNPKKWERSQKIVKKSKPKYMGYGKNFRIK